MHLWYIATVLVLLTATLATIEMSNAMAENGADAVLVVTPSFYKNQMISEALLKHYTEVSMF